MILSRLNRYWACQIAGWTLLACLIMYIQYMDTKSELNEKALYFILIYAIVGMLVTHLFRFILKRYDIVNKPNDKSFIFIIIGFIATCFAHSLILEAISLISPINKPEEYKFEWKFFFISTLYVATVIAPWTLAYYIYHYYERTQKQTFDKLKLETTVKELELQTIKNHINPHFIFNALNSIRALVDENPQRARTAITELSNILRSSMQSEKLKTVPLSRELHIVQDYLALEHIRFEDRLRIEYEIDADTLEQPVPPMMLQTLVENAIKHGISKRLDGGEVKVISQFRENWHELVVLNTGVLDALPNKDGFGLSSTTDRLKLLFGKDATFTIRNAPNNMVECKVQMPVLVGIKKNHFSEAI